MPLRNLIKGGAWGTNLLWALRLFGQGPDQGPSRRLRFMLRVVACPWASTRWLRFLRGLNLLTPGILADGVLQQPFRPFFDARLRVADRVGLLIDHYRLILALVGAEALRDLESGKPIHLAEVPTKTGSALHLYLQKEDRFLKEGSLVLALANADGDALNLAFTLGNNGTTVAARIGCLQATSRDTAATLRELTRELHGIQPRILVVQALRMICRVWGVDAIEGVAAAHHVYQSRRYRRRKPVRSAYDDFWTLLGGKLQSSGNFNLPRDPPLKREEDFPSRQRAQRRQRTALLTAINAQIERTLEPPGASSHATERQGRRSGPD